MGYLSWCVFRARKHKLPASAYTRSQVPEINAHELRNAKLIANPNCTTAIAAIALWPLHRQFGIRTMILSTYQSASGAGAKVITMQCATSSRGVTYA